MAEPGQNEALKKLEKELTQCLVREEYLDALDIYDEILAKGTKDPRHLVGMGHCLMKLRRKQDAKHAWIEAFEIDSEFEPAIKLLNENFRGWKKALLAAKKPKPKPKPPSPPPVVSVQPGTRVSSTPGGAGAGPARAGSTPGVVLGVVAAAGAGSDRGPSLGSINWNYVFEDVADSGPQESFEKPEKDPPKKA